jgi:hypothetical protein
MAVEPRVFANGGRYYISVDEDFEAFTIGVVVNGVEVFQALHFKLGELDGLASLLREVKVAWQNHNND